jgi:hypothetical protein
VTVERWDVFTRREWSPESAQDLKERLERRLEVSSSQTDIADWGAGGYQGERESGEVDPNRHNLKNGEKAENWLTAIYPLGPARSPRNRPPDLVYGESMDDFRDRFEVKSCLYRTLDRGRLDPGEFAVNMDSHKKVKADLRDGEDFGYFFISRVPDDNIQPVDISLLDYTHVERMNRNEDSLQGVTSCQSRGQEILTIREDRPRDFAALYGMLGGGDEAITHLKDQTKDSISYYLTPDDAV